MRTNNDSVELGRLAYRFRVEPEPHVTHETEEIGPEDPSRRADR
jgi:hypothetical protein